MVSYVSFVSFRPRREKNLVRKQKSFLGTNSVETIEIEMEIRKWCKKGKFLFLYPFC